MSVQTVVEELRASGMNDAQIASEIGCGVSTVNMWGSGHRARRNGDYLLALFNLHQSRIVKAHGEAADSASQEAA